MLIEWINLLILDLNAYLWIDNSTYENMEFNEVVKYELLFTIETVYIASNSYVSQQSKCSL